MLTFHALPGDPPHSLGNTALNEPLTSGSLHLPSVGVTCCVNNLNGTCSVCASVVLSLCCPGLMNAEDSCSVNAEGIPVILYTAKSEQFYGSKCLCSFYQQ